MVLFIAMVKIFLMTNTLLFLPNFYVIEYVFNKFISKVVIFVFLFVCSIITHEPLDRFVSNFDWGTRENHGNVLSLVLRLKVEWVYFYRGK